jgi:hypothetical protein
MPQQTYSLSCILPIIRNEVKARGNFEYRVFAQQVWFALEKNKVEGVLRTPPERSYSGQVFEPIPQGLQNAAAEAFWFLMRCGYISPVPRDDQSGSLDLYRYNVTERGIAWFDGGEPLPEDIAGYMKFLRDRMPSLDAVVEQYMTEALIAFERQAYFASAVMLGAASEKALYILAEAMVDALKSNKARQTLEQHLKGRSLNPFFAFIRDTLERNRKLSNMPYDGCIAHLMSLFEAVRTQRNDAVHPTTGQVSADSVRLLTASFPYALSKSEELRAWLVSNPNSLD